jgi:UPF0716 family protein affecting phage T7 exclusion
MGSRVTAVAESVLVGDDPTLAVLEVGISEGAEATLVIGGFFSLVLGAVLVFALSPICRDVIATLTKSTSVANDHPQFRKSSKRKKPQ